MYVGSLAPGEQANISVDITSPAMPKIIKSQWRLFTSAGVPFGGKIETIVYMLVTPKSISELV